MLKKIQLLVLAAMVSVGLVSLVAAPVSYAACNTPAECVQDGVEKTGGKNTDMSAQEVVKLIVSALLFIIGALAVIMIIIGGIRYTISQGDSTAITSAKNTILYSVIGLIVAIFAYAIVNFVIDAFL